MKIWLALIIEQTNIDQLLISLFEQDSLFGINNN